MNEKTNSNIKNLVWMLIPISIMTVGQTFSKAGALKIAQEGRLVNLFVIGGYTLLILRGIIWIFILNKIKLLFAYPVMSLTYVLVLIIANVLFGEKITIANIGGAAFIILGITLMSLGEWRLEKNQ